MIIPEIIHFVACSFGLSGVLLGAIGAHFLKNKINNESLNSYKTAVLYQLLHTPILLFLASKPENFAIITYKYASYCFVLGVLGFSGSIYFLSTRELTKIKLLKWTHFVTPLGGVFLMIAWSLLAFSYKT